MFAEGEGGESRAEASSPGDGRCASGTVTLREIKEEERGEGKGSCGYRGYPVSQLLFSLSHSSADYGRGRNWIGHVDTSCPKGGQYPAGKEEEGARSSLGPAGPTWSVQDRRNVLAAEEEDDIEIEGGRGWGRRRRREHANCRLSRPPREVVLHSRRSVWNGRAAITGGEEGKQ